MKNSNKSKMDLHSIDKGTIRESNNSMCMYKLSNYHFVEWYKFRVINFIVFLGSILILSSYARNNLRDNLGILPFSYFFDGLFILAIIMFFVFRLFYSTGIKSHSTISIFNDYLIISGTSYSLNAIENNHQSYFSILTNFFPRRIKIKYCDVNEIIPNLIFNDNEKVSMFSIKLKNGNLYHFYYQLTSYEKNTVNKIFNYLQNQKIKIQTIDRIINSKVVENYIFQYFPSDIYHPAVNKIGRLSEFFNNKYLIEEEIDGYKHWLIVIFSVLIYEMMLVDNYKIIGIIFLFMIFIIVFLYDQNIFEKSNKYISKNLLETAIYYEKKRNERIVEFKKISSGSKLDKLIINLREIT